ncbi:uncharacterized protein J4E92_010327 [Alternaria infectoria]|uniref:uncharacterized protein n=1 Tax=Alternaria infectoria TaxID=45303 RepID=UPI002220F12B|nr:uncharacterized protein J4E92_010327 [Alternaria infectoria]KAI4911271.1 hypothetical protein J4E92_010327 [Alternaria infectoria]
MAKLVPEVEFDKFIDEFSAIDQTLEIDEDLWSRLVNPARGSVFVYNAGLRGFRQPECGSATFNNVPEIMSFLQRAPQLHGHAADSAAEVSEQMPAFPTQTVENITSINFLEFEFEKLEYNLLFALDRALMFLRPNWARLSSIGENQTSTTGSLFYSADRHTIAFQTPPGSTPFLHLSLDRARTGGTQRSWLAVLAYDKAPDWAEGEIADCKRRIETYKYPDNFDPGTSELTPFNAFAYMLNDFVAQYIRVVVREAMLFTEAIQEVENTWATKPPSNTFGPKPSTLLRELNDLNHQIRVSNLMTRFEFCADAAKWAERVRRSLDFEFRLWDLTSMVQRIQAYHPKRLRETIAEVRQLVNDTIAEGQQERQEELQLRQDARAKEEWDLLQKNLKIAEATLRDSRLMSGVAWITMAFLPATFVSSFFGMNFFSGKAGYPPFDEGSKNVWIFFLVALPITALVLGGFWYWNRQEKKKDEGKLKSVEEGATKNQDGATTAQSTGNDMEMPDTWARRAGTRQAAALVLESLAVVVRLACLAFFRI